MLLTEYDGLKNQNASNVVPDSACNLLDTAVDDPGDVSVVDFTTTMYKLQQSYPDYTYNDRGDNSFINPYSKTIDIFCDDIANTTLPQ